MKRRQTQRRPEKPTDFPPIIEVATPALIRGNLEINTRAFRMGDLSALVSQEPGMGWHMSVAHPERYPTWDEIAHLRYALLPEQVTMAMLLPPENEYINVHNHTFQLWQIQRVGV